MAGVYVRVCVYVCVCVCVCVAGRAWEQGYPHPYPPLAAGGLAIHSSSWEQPFFLSTRESMDSILLSPGSSAIARHTINTLTNWQLLRTCVQA